MNPHYDDGDVTVYHGDCLDVLRGLPDASVDAVVTDPPYGLEFMGKEWDSFAPADMVRRSGWEHAQSGAGIARDPSTPQGRTGVSFHKRRSTYKCGRCGKRDAFKNRQQCGGSGDHDWQHEWVDKQPVEMLAFQQWCQLWAAECLRVLKPGGHLLAFGGTRTYHRMACAIEDAGFEIRDSIHWTYGSGFPKSLNAFKNIKEQLCPSHESAPHAALVSPWHPVASPEAKAPIAVALARTLQGDVPVLLTRTGEAGDSPAMTATSWSELTATTSSNTDTSWRNIWDALCDPTSTSTTSTTTAATTAWQTCNSLTSQNTPDSTTPGRADPNDGCKCSAATVATPSSAASLKCSAIRIPTAPASAIGLGADYLAGTGTAAKPSHEPIVVARKPLVGTVAGNVLAHGTGAINVDACRVGTTVETWPKSRSYPFGGDVTYGSTNAPTEATGDAPAGRWPANTILTHAPDCDPDGGCGAGCPCAEMDAQSGVSTSVGVAAFKPRSVYNADAEGYDISGTEIGYGDTGGASRFFPAFYYTAKASSAERPRVGKAGGGNGKQNYGGYKVKCCDECGKRWPSTEEQSCGHDGWHWAEPLDRQPDTVAHPTVKPLDLMRWLVRLVTPPGGVVLEPFAGSGTTAEACVVEGFRCIAIEREADYLPLIEARLSKPIERTLL